VQDKHAGSLFDALIARGLYATTIRSTGGFPLDGNNAILVHVEDGQHRWVLDSIRTTCNCQARLINAVTATAESLRRAFERHSVPGKARRATVLVWSAEHAVRV
jgi:uncharacterized protein YaaQ